MKKIIFPFLFVISFCQLSAQPIIDTRGDDFWLAFLPNYHNVESYDPYKTYYTDTLYIFIVANEACSGIIDYQDYTGQKYTRNFVINDPSQIYVFSVKYEPFELQGFNESGKIIGVSQNETIAKQSFHITSTKDVTVYAHSQAITTSESLTALPTDALGKDYLILAYNSDGSPEAYSISGQSTPSQFLVIATEDNTNVTIVPTVPTRANKLKTQNIILNKGDVYLVQADITQSQLRNDLTGTKVTSDKPIVVIAGHQRTRLPINGRGGSRDMLMEELPPLNAWGRNSIVVPFAQSLILENTIDNDIFRVLAYSDNTQLFIDGDLVATLNEGELYEEYLDAPHFIDASAPILVAQYKKSAQTSGYTSSESDPLMLIMPPIEQYGNFYRFANIQANEYDYGIIQRMQKVYDEHYINIISPNNTLDNVKLDGNLVQVNSFKAVPNTNFSYAQLSVNEGTHEIACPGGCGLIVYGYGIANSYGYYGGMNLVKYDFTSPKLYANNGCYLIDGIATDSSATDTRLKQLDFPISDQKNVNIIANNTFPAPLARYSVSLINQYLDGSFKVRATDSAGLYSELNYDIPGFTIAMKDIKESTIVPEIIDTILYGKERCFDIIIENYGKFAHKINYLIVQSSVQSDTIPEYTGTVLQAGELRTFRYCITPSDSGIFNFDITIEDSCTKREITKLSLYSLRDTDPPNVQASIDSCNINYFYDIYEELKSDGGISNANLIESSNINVEHTEISDRHYQFKIGVIDPRQDTYFKIEVIDSAGNSTIIEVSRPGFTLQFSSSNQSQQIDFGKCRIGGLYIDTLLIYNYGNFPITLKDALLYYNLQFSIPQSQLPIVINPKDTAKVMIAYKPVYVKVDQDVDSLKFTLNCIDEVIPLFGLAEEFNINATSKCDVNIRFITDSIPSSLEITLADEYTKGIVELNISNTKNSNMEIYLYNSLGVMLEKLYSGTMQKGESKINIKMNNYSAGLYFVIIKNAGEQYSRKFIKIE
ncbi:MAG TPA: hypothetical protein DCW42_03450 [Bacteroidetes bacterium]|nr:hypothetical protein [Bacteroidota bacterium]